jgi:hypothetical protein
MTKRLWFNQNGKLDICGNGFIRYFECPNSECRKIVYVDKHATGTGDGSSPENAYTDIQTAASNHPCKEICIQGYGENDCYSAGIILHDCSYLHGVDDAWLDGEGVETRGISGNSGKENTKIDSVNVKNCRWIGIEYCDEVVNCTVKDISDYANSFFGGFYVCDSLDNCHAENIASHKAFSNCNYLNDCTANNCQSGIGNPLCPTTLTNCIVSNCRSSGFVAFENSILIDCVAYGLVNNDGNGGFSTRGATLTRCKSHDNNDTGFNGKNVPSNYIECESYNNYMCGYRTPEIANTYINCLDYNNCLSGHWSCTLSHPNHRCSEI